MDSYTISFALPRLTGSHAFVAESATPPLNNEVDSNSDHPSGANYSTANSPVQGYQHQSPLDPPTAPIAPQPTTGRLGSMRSRFPPSVKALMPSAFVGKRTSERIAEITGSGEKEDDAAEATGGTGLYHGSFGASDVTLGRTSFERRRTKLTSTSSLPLAVPEEGYHSSNKEDILAVDSELRASGGASKSITERSSFDFCSPAASSSDEGGSARALSGEPATQDDKKRRSQVEGQTSNGPAAGRSHSHSNSTASLGVQQPLTASELAQATQDLSIAVMNTTSCLISCTPLQDDATSVGSIIGHTATSSSSSISTWPSSAASPYSTYSPFGGHPIRQLQQTPFSGGTLEINAKGSHPYQHHADGYSQEAGGFNSMAFPNVNGTFGSTTSLNSTLGQQQQQQQQQSQAQSGASLLAPSLSSDSKSSQNRKIPRYNFHLSGTFQQVMEARAMIMREHPFKSQVTVRVARADIFEAQSGPSGGLDTMKSHVRARLDELAAATGTRVTVVCKDNHPQDVSSGFHGQRIVDVVIFGQLQGVEFARVRTLVLIDELAGLTSTTCEIDQKFHNIIGGRKRAVIQSIQEQTSTSVYLPLPLGRNVGGSGHSAAISLENTIYITGDFFSVQRARDMLYQIYQHKSKCTISRNTRILSRKIDWLLADHLEDVRQIMIDNGTFIGLPALGSQDSMVTVYGDNRVSIERSIRTFMALTCQFYIASVWLLPPVDAYQGAVPAPTTVNPAHLTPFLKVVVNKSGAEVVFKDNCFEIHGVEVEVKHAVSMILDLDLVRKFPVEVRFQIELAATEREFLQGRKCGKINKIMKACGVRINFETFNDFNFLIELAGADRLSVLQGLALLQEELPAEVSFHVPEAYHKRCIGVAGKQIQKVMKKYGVYVKFSNAEEFAALGGYMDNEDNVIARTPAKNAINLENLKQSVMEMVNPKDKDYITETVIIPRRYHRALQGEKGIFIHDIENKSSSKIYFPPRETCSDIVSIFGPESQLQTASSMLSEHVPLEAEYRIPNASNLAQVLGSQDFVAFVERIRSDLSISIVPVAFAPTAPEAVFKLCLNRNSAEFLPSAREFLEKFLTHRNISVYPPPARDRSDSFATSFPHFANKLIAAPGAEGGAAQGGSAGNEHDASSYQAELAARFHDGGRLRAAASSPALKALFDSPTAFGGNTPRVGGGHHQSQSFAITSSASGAMGPFGNGVLAGPSGPLDAPGLVLGNGLVQNVTTGLGNGVGTGLRNPSMGSMGNSGNPSHSPVIGSSLYTSPYSDSRAGGLSNDVWSINPGPTSISNVGAVPLGVHLPRQQSFHAVGSGSRTHHSARQSGDFGHRGTIGHSRGPVDSFGLDQQADGGGGNGVISNIKMGAHSHGYRAQSLDVTQRGARQAAAEANAFVSHNYGGSSGNGFGCRVPNHSGAGASYGFPAPFGEPGILGFDMTGGNAYTHQPPTPGGFGSRGGPGHSPAASISRLPASSGSYTAQAPAHSPEDLSRILSGLNFAR